VVVGPDGEVQQRPAPPPEPVEHVPAPEGGGGDGGVELACEVGEHLAEQRRLVLEVVVEGAPGHACGLDDFGGRRAGEAVGGEQVPRRGDDGRAGHLRFLCRASHHRRSIAFRHP
jgi:hypothetical protein